MKPPLKTVPMNPTSLTAAELLEHCLAWLEYACSALEGDPHRHAIIQKVLPELNRVLTRLQAHQS
jgi:hypothetical protein